MSMQKLSGKVAVVTGASKGIGASIAKHYGAEGAAVVVNYSSSRAGADAVVTEITKAGGRAIAVQADVAKRTEIEKLFAETKKVFGRLDILVNNAGVFEFRPLLGRIGRPQDIATAAVYFGSDDSSWVTGETLRISGGHGY